MEKVRENAKKNNDFAVVAGKDDAVSKNASARKKNTIKKTENNAE